MRTSCMVSIALVLMLAGATTALAGSSSYSCADSSGTYYTDADAHVSRVTVPSTGIHNWSHSLNAFAQAVIADSGPNSSYARASAYASVDHFGFYTVSIFVSAEQSDTPGVDSDSDSASDSGTSFLIVGQSLEFAEYCETVASWNSPDLDSEAWSQTYVITQGGLY